MDQMCETEHQSSAHPMDAAITDTSRIIHNVDTVDFNALENIIEADLVKADIAVPLMILFPPKPTQAYYQPSDVMGLIVGVGPELHDELIVNRWECMHEGLFKKEQTCSFLGFHIAFGTIPQATRIFTAVHEVTHHVAAKENLVYEIVEGLSFFSDMHISEDVHMKFNKEVADNIKECIADAGALLYVYSNFQQVDKAQKLSEDWANLRALFAEPSHYTVATLKRTKEEFASRPVSGLSIVDTTRWAADIVRRQGDEVISTFSSAVLAHFIIIHADNYGFPDETSAQPVEKIIQKSAKVRQKYFDRAEEAAKNVPPLPKWKSCLYGLLTRMPVYLPG